MKTRHAILPLGALCATAALLAAAPLAKADTAEVSEVVKSVELGSRQASVGDTVSGATSLKTGRKARAELTFQDSTLLRIGSNTIFSFAKSRGKSKDFNLIHGTAFISAPDVHNGVRINCGGVTAAITGSTSTVTNTNSGVGLFAATGNNSFILPDGSRVDVAPFHFTWIPALLDANGNRIGLDFANKVTFPFDAKAQTDTGHVTRGLSEEIKQKILDKKNELFQSGALQNTPSPNDNNKEQDNKQDSNTIGRDVPINDCITLQEAFDMYGDKQGLPKGFDFSIICDIPPDFCRTFPSHSKGSIPKCED